MNPHYEKLLRCRDTVFEKSGGFQPRMAMILGSGLGNLGKVMDVQAEVPYKDIPGFPVSGVPGHAGKFLFGTLEGVPMVCMQGRVHYYEGFPIQDVVLPTRVMGLLGAKKLFLTNAAGGLDPQMEAPAMMLITDHIMLNFPNPLIGGNLDELGTRFPDMSQVYDRAMNAVIRQKARDLSLPLHEGVYVQLTGPSFETPAEVKLLGLLGGGTVGMSTACEATVARHMGLRVCGISCITNQGAGIAQHPLTHQEVFEAGIHLEERMTRLVRAAVPEIDKL